jgi:nucleoside-diphosphate-sugar epimerase
MDTLSQGEPLSRILLTGATGYVGGRLLTALEAAGYHIRCLARRPEALQHRVGSRVEIMAGDLQGQRFDIDRSQKRMAACTQPSALVPVPSPKPWPTFG